MARPYARGRAEALKVARVHRPGMTPREWILLGLAVAAIAWFLIWGLVLEASTLTGLVGMLESLLAAGMGYQVARFRELGRTR